MHEVLSWKITGLFQNYQHFFVFTVAVRTGTIVIIPVQYLSLQTLTITETIKEVSAIVTENTKVNENTKQTDRQNAQDHLLHCKVDIGGDEADESYTGRSYTEGTLTTNRLAGGIFLDAGDVIRLLLETDSTLKLSKVPNSLKENVYFVVDNEVNRNRRHKGEKSSFDDDCGAWCSSSSPSLKLVFLRVEHSDSFILVHERSGVLCMQRQENGVIRFVPYDPQPDPTRVIRLYRHYNKLKACDTYTKRISWIDGDNHTGALPSM